MPYAEGSAYITHAEWETLVGADIVSALVGADTTKSLRARESASNEVDERALSAHVDIPLSADYLTVVMKRRVAWVAAHHAASELQRARNAQGRAPYHDEHDRALQSMDRWAAGLKVLPGDVANGATDEATYVVTNTRRNWRRR